MIAWTNDQIAITVAAFIFFTAMIAWLLYVLRRRAAPVRVLETGERADYVYAVTETGVKAGDGAREWQRAS